jgi:hypothetical protein
MKSIDLTDIDDNLVIDSHLVMKRIGEVYLSTDLIDNAFLKRLDDLPIDLIIDFNAVSRVLINGQDLQYLHLPIKKFEDIHFDFLNALNKLLESSKKGVLLYCDSPNLLAGLLGVYFANICGHPIKRAYDIACRLGLENNLERNKMQKYLNLKGEMYEE